MRYAGSLIPLTAPGFVEPLESVRGDPAKLAARERAFVDDRSKAARVAPTHETVGAFLPRAARTPIRQRPAHVEEAIEAGNPRTATEEPAVEAAPVESAMPKPALDHAAARDLLRATLPARRWEILAAIPWYAKSKSRETTLSKDLRALGATSTGHGGVWSVGEPAPTATPTPGPAPAAAPAKPRTARPVRTPPHDLQAATTKSLVGELVRRAEHYDRLLAALRGIA